MSHAELTETARAATNLNMDRGYAVNRSLMWFLVPLMASMGTLAGCISVNAPNDAIVIELNINIKQEVIYRLAEDAGNTIEENADIF